MSDSWDKLSDTDRLWHDQRRKRHRAPAVLRQDAGTIAATRKVAVGTVRAQIKALLAKAGVHRQIELVARLNQL